MIPHRLAFVLAAAALVSACASAPSAVAQERTQVDLQDANDPSMVPAGFGSLRQDDISVRVSLQGGLLVRAVPLDESFIRLLSPDSYRAMREIINTKSTELDRLKQRGGMSNFSLWFISFFAQEQGETRFSPLEIVISNVGRDFRPIDMFALTPGFGEQRLRQRETQSALFVFDGQLDVNQPLTMIVETAESREWQTVLRRVERERTLVRTRSGGQARRDSAGSAQ